MSIVLIILLVYFMSFSLSNGKAQYISQPLNEHENVNATSSDGTVYGQTNGTLDNQTMRATNGTRHRLLMELVWIYLLMHWRRRAASKEQSQPALQSPPSLQQQPLPPIMQPPSQEPIYCYYPNYNPQCVSGQTIQISISTKCSN